MATKIIKQYYFTSETISSWQGKDYMVIESTEDAPNYYITQVGIQGLPGVKFHFDSYADTLILNGLGYFDLDLTGTGANISNIYIDVQSATSRARNNPKGYLIIDVILQIKETIEENGGGV